MAEKMIDERKFKEAQALMREDFAGTKVLIDSMDQPYADAKALANFMFSELIADAYEKYNIPLEDIGAMSQAAVNRAQFYLRFTKNGRDKTARDVFRVKAHGFERFDAPEMTDDLLELEQKLERYEAMMKGLNEAIGR